MERSAARSPSARVVDEAVVSAPTRTIEVRVRVSRVRRQRWLVGGKVASEVSGGGQGG